MQTPDGKLHEIDMKKLEEVLSSGKREIDVPVVKIGDRFRVGAPFKSRKE